MKNPYINYKFTIFQQKTISITNIDVLINPDNERIEKFKIMSTLRV